MRKSLILIVLILLTLAGCKGGNTAFELDSVKINLPSDNSVNGYRIEDNQDENRDDSTVPADKVTVGSVSGKKPENKPSYCANKNSKVFHKSTCDSVPKIKEKNKLFSSSKDALLKDGYSPCKRCEP